MNKIKAQEKLQSIGQEHLLRDFESWLPEEKSQFLEQVENLNATLFRQQQKILLTKKENQETRSFSPFEPFQDSKNEDFIQKGKELIAQGKVGAILIAGGLGSRLNTDQPKGMYPISLIQKKTLFQVFAEKVIAAGELAKRKLHLAIMTSSQNFAEITEYFEKNNFFGIRPKEIEFFVQKELPLLDASGNLFLDRKGHFSVGPDGNGSSLLHFYQSGIWDVWHDQGIRYVTYVPIDNPLADPFDASLIGCHAAKEQDIVIKCIKREDPKESVGVLVKENGHPKVVEYTELSEEEKTARTENGALKHILANLSLFSFSLNFIEKTAYTELPLHLAHKSAPFIDDQGKLVRPQTPNAWKFEKFIFDIIEKSNKIGCLVYPREECFAPLKNFEGKDSVQTVQQALLAKDRKILEELTGEAPPEEPIELSQDFYYPTESLKAKWKGRKLQKGGYLTASS